MPLAFIVILNVVKNLSVCTRREMFRFAQHDRAGYDWVMPLKLWVGLGILGIVGTMGSFFYLPIIPILPIILISHYSLLITHYSLLTQLPNLYPTPRSDDMCAEPMR